MAFDQHTQWQMHPLRGSTGEAYMGIKDNEKVFFKRNSSPFIASLSAEGLAPKLMWTQRTYSGDLLTAQEWKNASHLEREDMDSLDIVHLVHKIHNSQHLRVLLKRIQNQAFKPLDFIELYFKNLPTELVHHQFFNDVIQQLEDMVDDDFYHCQYVVCHGDLNHHNFLKDENQQLFLVDWEDVKLADPLSDIAWFLVQYFQPSSWMRWFEDYQFPIDETFYKRVRWYSLMSCLLLIKQFTIEKRHYKVNHYVMLLKNILQQ